MSIKKIYYFSRKQLQFIEIKNLNRKIIFLVFFFTIVFTFLIFTGYFIINQYINPDDEVMALQERNEELKGLYRELLSNYKELNNKLGGIVKETYEIKSGEYHLSGGGNILLPSIDFNFRDADALEKGVDNLELLMRQITEGWNGIKERYVQKSETLLNKGDLAETIPAIQPADGLVDEIFGYKKHPVLKIEILNKGIKIVAPENTEVFAPGGGRVEYAGRLPGYGWTLKIDHGYGYVSVLSNLSRLEVRRGNSVKRGDLVAYTGVGSPLQGPHLYYEVDFYNEPLNPMNFILGNLKIFEKKTKS